MREQELKAIIELATNKAMMSNEQKAKKFEYNMDFGNVAVLVNFGVN